MIARLKKEALGVNNTYLVVHVASRNRTCCSWIRLRELVVDTTCVSVLVC